MNLQGLSTGVMRALSIQWTGEDRAVLERLPGADEIIEDLGAFLREPTVQQAPAPNPLPALDEALVQADTAGDRFIRGGLKVLEGLSILARTAEARAALDGLRERLFPTGGKLANAAWVEHGAQAEGVQARLTDDDRALAGRIRLLETDTLADAVTAWQANGTILRTTSARRAELRKAEAERPSPSAAELTARRAWVRTARFLVEAVGRSRRLSDADRRTLLSPLEEAVAEANVAEARRAAARRAALAPVVVAPAETEPEVDTEVEG